MAQGSGKAIAGRKSLGNSMRQRRRPSRGFTWFESVLEIILLIYVGVLFLTRPLGIQCRRPVMVYFVALPFVRVDGGPAPGEAVEYPHEGAAIRRAQAMACSEAIAGAVAFSRRGSPDRC